MSEHRDSQQQTQQPSSFQDAADQQGGGLLADFVGFMRENTKWWLIPFLVVFGLLAILILLGSTGAAPFIYTMW